MTEAVFEHRGVIEGFYGTPFSSEDRRWLIERMGAWGMNRYVVAPKDDPLGREQWRDPYPRDALDGFETLVSHGRAHGVEVGFALSPGLSIEYASAADRSTLRTKFAAFAERGARFFCLALDDVPTHLVHPADCARFSSLAAAHVALANDLREGLPDGAWLWLVPTDYAGRGPSQYLATLGSGLHPDTLIAWSGRTVVSPTIEGHEARERAAAVGRRLLLWDNYPVSDGPMRPMLHLGPYCGRDPDLPESVSGILLNPMEHAHASAVGLQTAAEYLAAPARYDPDAAWQRAVASAGAGAPAAFAQFAAAHCFSALAPEARDRELEAAIRALEDAWDRGPGEAEALRAVAAGLSVRSAANETLRSELTDGALAREISPWLAAHREETERMRAAADLLAALRSGEDSLVRVQAFFRFQGRLTRLETPRHASYGPRRVVYPQLVSLDDDGAGFGSDPALFLDRCLADDLVRFAEARGLACLSKEPAPTRAG